MLCAALGVSSVTALTLAECETQYTCSSLAANYKMVSLADACLCCEVDANGATTTTCLTPASNGAASSAATLPVQCTASHCRECPDDKPSACVTCDTGYYVSEERCVLEGGCTVAHCTMCMLADATKCSVCMNGYMKTSSFTCATNAAANVAGAPLSLSALTVALALLSVFAAA